MPMIEVHVAAGTFGDGKKPAQDLAATLMAVEQVPDIPMFRKNTAAFVHAMPADQVSNLDGDSTYIRVRVLTNAGALDRDEQLAVVRRTDRPGRRSRRRSVGGSQDVDPAHRPEGGWGPAGPANTNADLVAAARAQLAQIAAANNA